MKQNTYRKRERESEGILEDEIVSFSFPFLRYQQQMCFSHQTELSQPASQSVSLTAPQAGKNVIYVIEFTHSICRTTATHH